MKNFSVAICTDLQRLQIFTELNNDQWITIAYSKLTAITKNTPTKYVAEVLQQQHFINTSTNPEGCHMSNFICQNEVNMVNEPLKVEKSVLEFSSEMDKLRCITDTALSPVTKIIVMGTNFPSREFWVMENFN